MCLSDFPARSYLTVDCGPAVPARLDSAVGTTAVVVSQREPIVALLVSVDHSVPAEARAAILLFGAVAPVLRRTVDSALPAALHFANTAAPSALAELPSSQLSPKTPSTFPFPQNTLGCVGS